MQMEQSAEVQWLADALGGLDARLARKAGE
jgi:hypothetical protein